MPGLRTFALTVAVRGGATRADSVQQGLAALQGESAVLVHDAARPFLTATHIRGLLAALESADGAVPALPVADTLKPGELISKTTHEAMGMLLGKAAADIERTLPSLRAAPQPAIQPEAAPAPAPAAAAPSSSASADERLRKLKKLHDDGLITDEAYQKKQQEILNEY